MRLLTAILLVLAAPAIAHVSPRDQSIAESVNHQIFSLHHLPVTLLLLVILIVAARVITGTTAQEIARKR